MRGFIQRESSDHLPNAEMILLMVAQSLFTSCFLPFINLSRVKWDAAVTVLEDDQTHQI